MKTKNLGPLIVGAVTGSMIGLLLFSCGPSPTPVVPPPAATVAPTNTPTQIPTATPTEAPIWTSTPASTPTASGTPTSTPTSPTVVPTSLPQTPTPCKFQSALTGLPSGTTATFNVLDSTGAALRAKSIKIP